MPLTHLRKLSKGRMYSLMAVPLRVFIFSRGQAHLSQMSKGLFGIRQSKPIPRGSNSWSIIWMCLVLLSACATGMTRNMTLESIELAKAFLSKAVVNNPPI